MTKKMVLMLGIVMLAGTSVQVQAEQLAQPGLEIEIIRTDKPLPPPPPPPRMGDPVKGAALYEQCVSCHGLQAKGLTGQTEAELMAEMQNYQMNTYTDPRILKMQRILNGMSQEQLLNIAAYIVAQ